MGSKLPQQSFRKSARDFYGPPSWEHCLACLVFSIGSGSSTGPTPQNARSTQEASDTPVRGFRFIACQTRGFAQDVRFLFSLSGLLFLGTSRAGDRSRGHLEAFCFSPNGNTDR